MKALLRNEAGHLKAAARNQKESEALALAAGREHSGSGHSVIPGSGRGPGTALAVRFTAEKGSVISEVPLRADERRALQVLGHAWQCLLQQMLCQLAAPAGVR